MAKPDSLHFGFKKITRDNWSEPDLPKLFPALIQEDWFNAVLAPQLNATVPADVRSIYEVARAAFVYAWQFYPFLSLGQDHCFRVVEAALAMKCHELGIRTSNGFKAKLDSMIKAGVISKSELHTWDIIRKLRNRASHLTMQTILPIGMTLPTLQITADRINRLFP